MNIGTWNQYDAKDWNRLNLFLELLGRLDLHEEVDLMSTINVNICS